MSSSLKYFFYICIYVLFCVGNFRACLFANRYDSMRVTNWKHEKKSIISIFSFEKIKIESRAKWKAWFYKERLQIHTNREANKDQVASTEMIKHLEVRLKQNLFLFRL